MTSEITEPICVFCGCTPSNATEDCKRLVDKIWFWSWDNKHDFSSPRSSATPSALGEDEGERMNCHCTDEDVNCWCIFYGDEK